jgi:hypothetical protein
MSEEKPIMRDDLTATASTGRDAKSGQFTPGYKPPCMGRGPSGRTKALRALDAVLATEDNQQKLQAALQASFDKNPVKFFRTFVMPLLPKEAKVEMDTAGAVLWTRISDAFPPERDE